MLDVERILLNGAIVEIGKLYRGRLLSVREAVSWYLSRIMALKHLNAIRELSRYALDDANRAD